jgi:hypothetical protein
VRELRGALPRVLVVAAAAAVVTTAAAAAPRRVCLAADEARIGAVLFDAQKLADRFVARRRWRAGRLLLLLLLMVVVPPLLALLVTMMLVTTMLPLDVVSAPRAAAPFG